MDEDGPDDGDVLVRGIHTTYNNGFVGGTSKRETTEKKQMIMRINSAKPPSGSYGKQRQINGNSGLPAAAPSSVTFLNGLQGVKQSIHQG